MHPPRSLRPVFVTAALVGLLALPGGLRGQTSPRCTDPEFRQLDFWVGAWQVTDAEGQLVGRSTVSPILDRCALREEWDSGDMHGTSINMFAKPERTWRQMWVDNLGVVLRLGGSWNGESMVLEGDRVGSDGKTRRLRVTLTPKPDGTLRQLQERSEDGGKTWAVIFEGTYTKAARSR